MSQINWITPTGSIAQIAEEEYFEFQLDAYDTSGSALTYKVIAGSLSSGLQLFKTGLIQGIPVVETASTTIDKFVQTFTVRATNAQGKISDRTFSIAINQISLPQIVPRDVSLGSYYDGYFLDINLVATDPNPTSTLEWKVIGGELPLGVTLTSAGRLSGNILPFLSAESEALLGWSVDGWGIIPWDTPTAAAQSKTYNFTVRVFDGSRYDNTKYSILVQAKSLFTVDNSTINVSDTNITVDTDNKHSPFITTLPQELMPQRQLSNFAFKFDGNDLDGDAIKFGVIMVDEVKFDQGHTATQTTIPDVGFDLYGFDQGGQSLPAGIQIDNNTGWLTGHLAAQSEEEKTYQFQIYCYKAQDPAFVSIPVTFTLTVLGDLNNTITWATPSILGSIDNGSVSEFSISAISTLGKILNYRIKESDKHPPTGDPSGEVVTYTPSARSRLPQGLQLLPNGLIVGRVSFDHFSIDGGTTTIDKKTTNFDNICTFTITASDETNTSAATVSDDKTFEIDINNYNITPYENIYLKALTSREQRISFNALIDNEEIFPSQLMFRNEDPWFGKAKDIKFLFAAGLTPSLASTYIGDMSKNHYNKRINLGNVKTAVALDENFNVKYEVVYIDIVDDDTVDGKSVAAIIDRSAQIKSPYNVMPYTTIYPNSLDNMKNEVSSGVGYSNKSALPQWMLNQQEDGRVLGFTRGIILAYTVPGAAKLVAYRLKQVKVDFNDVDFVADRYQLDHHMSSNFDINTNKFKVSKETTFDRLPSSGDLHPYAGSVDFALTVPFDEINGRTVEYILRTGGIDGSTIADGQLVIFARQENYSLPLLDEFAYVKDPFDNNNFDNIGFNLSTIPRQYTSPNEGWNIEDGLYGATLYGSTPYAPATIVPGFLDNLLSPEVLNERGGIWKVTIGEDDVVTLEFVNEVPLDNYIQVSGGSSYGGTKLYYDPIIKPGHSVPEYSILTDQLSTADNATRFDSNATRFYSNRDVFAGPETDDVYLKFPKFDVYR